MEDVSRHCYICEYKWLYSLETCFKEFKCLGEFTMKKGKETLEVKDNQEENHKVIEFKTRAQIAMGDETPVDPDWLMGLNEGCMFLARKKDIVDESLFQFTVLAKKELSVWLCLTLPEDKSLERWVDSSRYSSNWELFEILQEGYPV